MIELKQLSRTFFTHSLKHYYSSNCFSCCNMRLIVNQQFLKRYSITGGGKCLLSYKTEFSFLLLVLHNMCGCFLVSLTDRWCPSIPSQSVWVFYYLLAYFPWWVLLIQHTSCASCLWPRWLWPRKGGWRQVAVIVCIYVSFMPSEGWTT